MSLGSKWGKKLWRESRQQSTSAAGLCLKSLITCLLHGYTFITTCVVESHTKVSTLPLACISTDSSSWRSRVQISFGRNKGSECHVVSKLILHTVLEHEGFPSELKRVWIVYSLTNSRFVFEANYCPRENHVYGGSFFVKILHELEVNVDVMLTFQHSCYYW